MRMKLAPIVLFVYNRPWHTEQTLNALSLNQLSDQSVLYVFADGPKAGASDEELQALKETRNIVRSKKWCGEVFLIERDSNWGLAKSIIAGVTQIVNESGKVIVLEDDIVTSVGFLKYMNDALSMYEYEERVMHVSGYNYISRSSSAQETFFVNILSCWGWGTWRRAWDKYEHDVDSHLSKLNSSAKIKKFNIEGHADFYSQLILNKEGKIFSWAVRWYASWLNSGGYSLFPKVSLVRNIGHDGSGVHCGISDTFDSYVTDYIDVCKIPILEAKSVRKEIDRYYKKRIGLNKRKDSSYKIIKKVFLRIGFIRWLTSCVRRLAKKIVFFIIPELRSVVSARDEVSQLRSVSPLSKISENVKLYKPYRIIRSHVGEYTYIAENAYIQYSRIGKFCSIGPNFYCGRGIHPLNGISTAPMFYSTMSQNGVTLSPNNKITEIKDIKIGNDVFIGMNVSVLDGVTIGDGAVIGAGAVVVNNIPPYAIAVGVPARVIRYRFPPDIIEALMRIKWWDFPKEDLKEVENSFFDIERFVNKYDR